MFFDNFWRQKKSNFTVYVFWYFLMILVILIIDAFYMSFDAILPLLDSWRMHPYQILFKIAFFHHEIDFYLNSIALGLYWAPGRTLLIGHYI